MPSLVKPSLVKPSLEQPSLVQPTKQPLAPRHTSRTPPTAPRRAPVARSGATSRATSDRASTFRRVRRARSRGGALRIDSFSCSLRPQTRHPGGRTRAPARRFDTRQCFSEVYATRARGDRAPQRGCNTPCLQHARPATHWACNAPHTTTIDARVPARTTAAPPTADCGRWNSSGSEPDMSRGARANVLVREVTG